MPVIAKLRFKGKDFGLLAVLYPGVRIIRNEEYPPFLNDEQVIVVSEKEPLTCYPDKQVIQVTSRGGGYPVDSRDGFLEILARRGVKATNYQVGYLREDACDDEFWRIAKAALFLKRFPGVPRGDPFPEDRATVLSLFNKLFEDFDEAAKIYFQLQRKMAPRTILSSLLTMVMKSMNPRAYNVSGYYRGILGKNQKYVPIFRKAIYENYLDGCTEKRLSNKDKEMICIFAMIAACSAHTRPHEKGRFSEESEFDWAMWGTKPGGAGSLSDRR